MAYLVAKTTIEESTGLVSTTDAGHMALHNDKAKAVNSLTDEMIDARNPALATPAETATSVPDLLGQLKQMLKNITGETNWFDGVATTLASVATTVTSLLSDVSDLLAKFPVVTADITDDAVTYDKVLDILIVDIVDIVNAGATDVDTTITTIGSATFTVPAGRTYKALVLADVGSSGAGAPGAGTEAALYKYTKLDTGGNDFNGWSMWAKQSSGSSVIRYTGSLAKLYTSLAAGSHTIYIRTRTVAGTIKDPAARGVVILMKDD